MSNLRIVKRKDGDNWTTIQLNELKVGDIFIMFDSPNDQVGGEWVAKSEPTLNGGVWGISVNERTN